MFRFAENVASMSCSTRRALTSSLALPCYICCPSNSTPVRRPRLYWFDSCISPTSGVTISESTDNLRSINVPSVPFPDHRDWCEPGWKPVSPTIPFPTFVCASSTGVPHPNPSGIDRADSHAQARWKADNFKFPPYQCCWEARLVSSSDPSSWRRPSVLEREVLHCVRPHHILFSFLFFRIFRFAGV